MSESVTDLTKGVYRRIYAGFIKGQRINKLSLEAEACFWRILVVADDCGNVEADPELVWAATTGRRKGVTVKHVAKWLREMKDAHLIELYKAKSEFYLHVTGFEETQPAGKNGRRIQRVPSPGESGLIQGNPDVVSASDNDNDNDNEDEHEVRAAKPRSPGSKPNLCDNDFLDELQADEAYQRLNVRHIHAKMLRVCGETGKVPTRRRLINWLNREDQPMENGNGTSKQTGYQTATERRDAEFRGKLAIVEELRNSSLREPDETLRRQSS